MIFEDWGLIDYEYAWQRQNELVKKCRENQDLNVFVLCEHPTVITIGRNGTKDNIVCSHESLLEQRIKIIDVNRGGDITLHNPGQLIGYPIFNLNNYQKDLHWFLREIESCIIELLDNYNLKTERIQGLTGVWIEEKRKICSIGLHCSRWITSHGLALNVSNDLKEFDYIIPCGISNKEVTSIEKEIGRKVDFNEIKSLCKEIIKRHF